MANFQTDEQAMTAGLLLGLFMRQGVEARPVVDDDGNYTPNMLIKIDLGEDGLGKPVFVTAEIAVLP